MRIAKQPFTVLFIKPLTESRQQGHLKETLYQICIFLKEILNSGCMALKKNLLSLLAEAVNLNFSILAFRAFLLFNILLFFSYSFWGVGSGPSLSPLYSTARDYSIPSMP